MEVNQASNAGEQMGGKRKKTWRRRVFEILEVADAGDRASQIFDISLLVLILANLVVITLETVEGLTTQYRTYFEVCETVSITIFTIEYLLRIWSCTAAPDFQHPVLGRLKFLFTPLALIDLMALAPFYLPLLIPIDIRFIRFVRLLRVLRLFKLSRYFQSFQVLGNILKSKRDELLVTLMGVFGLLWLASTMMYFIEHDAQPEAFANIPATMWWGVATLTTVGYGDIYPVTTAGRVLGSVISILGIGLFALPTGILASGFTEELDRRKQLPSPEPSTCPHCGKPL
ncbi:ion transporter [Acaryochloris marina]|nr:ion transporter [Acaryochloris marina]BDM81983.1 potassium voltage gated channel, Shab-related subfamily, member 2 [Acaryochloris marina MBIC10699]